MSNSYTLFDEHFAPGQPFAAALHWLTNVPKSAIRLPNWGEDVALFYCKKSDRLIWTHDAGVDVELLGKEIISSEWEIWRLK